MTPRSARPNRGTAIRRDGARADRPPKGGDQRQLPQVADERGRRAAPMPAARSADHIDGCAGRRRSPSATRSAASAAAQQGVAHGGPARPGEAGPRDGRLDARRGPRLGRRTQGAASAAPSHVTTVPSGRRCADPRRRHRGRRSRATRPRRLRPAGPPARSAQGPRAQRRRDVGVARARSARRDRACRCAGRAGQRARQLVATVERPEAVVDRRRGVTRPSTRPPR